MNEIVRLGGLYNQTTRWGIYYIYGVAPCITASMGCGGGYIPMIIVEVNDERRQTHNRGVKPI